MNLNQLRDATIAAYEREMQCIKDNVMRPPTPYPERMKYRHYLNLFRRRKPPPIIARRPITANPDTEHMDALTNTGLETEKKLSMETQPDVEEITLDESDEERRMINRQHTCLYGFPKIQTVCSACGIVLELNEFVALCQSCRFLCHISCIDSMPRNCDPDICIIEFQPVKFHTGLIQCLLEIENRCNRNGSVFYAIDVSPSQVEALEDKFNDDISLQHYLKMVDVNVMCAAVKKFLKELRNPLLPPSLRDEILDLDSPVLGLELVSREVLNVLMTRLTKDKLETLAMLMRHFKKLLKSPRVWLNKSKQQKIFSALVFCGDGYHIGIEAFKNQKAFSILLLVSSARWSHILKDNPADSCQNATDNSVISVPSDTPDYRQICIPIDYFICATRMVGEQSLDLYMEELTESDYVPYILTEYINDEETQNAVRKYFQPQAIPPDYRRLMLKMQPEFAPYFNGLPI